MAGEYLYVKKVEERQRKRTEAQESLQAKRNSIDLTADPVEEFYRQLNEYRNYR